ncbi:hypothetical protein D046_4933 [Vibrio parahaemolyticus V-223/04]|nr:hypothetical protein D046_4933 [Vibrio parahaemolyticus V-223/04]
MLSKPSLFARYWRMRVKHGLTKKGHPKVTFSNDSLKSAMRLARN